MRLGRSCRRRRCQLRVCSQSSDKNWFRANTNTSACGLRDTSQADTTPRQFRPTAFPLAGDYPADLRASVFDYVKPRCRPELEGSGFTFAVVQPPASVLQPVNIIDFIQSHANGISGEKVALVDQPASYALQQLRNQRFNTGQTNHGRDRGY